MSEGFSPIGHQGTLEGGAEAIVAGGPLAKRWLAPPFTVLDARSGDWQERKAAWIGLGITSEIGRGENLLGFSDTVNAGGYDRGTRAALKSESGYEYPNAHLDEKNRRALGVYFTGGDALKTGGGGSTGTSIFDPVVCELAYSWWSPEGGSVLDPFAGGSVRGIVAGCLGRSYLGVDLSSRQVEANREQAAVIGPARAPRWVCGDSLNLAELAAEGAPYDFALSCPPYGDLEQYSDDPRDLSNMAHAEFEDAHWRIIGATLELLARDAFACWVVGDFRGKDGNYRSFVSSTIDAFQAYGARLYNEAILVTPTGSMSLRAERIFRPSRKLIKGHQNVLVFVKGDWRKAAARCQPAEAPEEEEL